jgi:hypothetical protein
MKPWYSEDASVEEGAMAGMLWEVHMPIKVRPTARISKVMVPACRAWNLGSTSCALNVLLADIKGVPARGAAMHEAKIRSVALINHTAVVLYNCCSSIYEFNKSLKIGSFAWCRICLPKGGTQNNCDISCGNDVGVLAWSAYQRMFLCATAAGMI